MAAGWALTALVPARVAAQHDHHGSARPAVPVLDTVRATADRDAVVLRSGATIVDARSSMAAGGSVADLLRTVPGIEVDADGRIGMRGSTSVQVLLDGRRIPLAGDALAAYLRQMPAAALDRVEAATTASARDDADGAAGVVNLVTRGAGAGARSAGTRSAAGSVATADHYMGAASASGALRNVMTWDATYSASAMRPAVHSQTTRWTAAPAAPARHVDSRAQAAHQLHSVALGAAVPAGSNVRLELHGTYSWMEGAYRTSTAFADLEPTGSRSTNATQSRLDHAIPAASLRATARVERGGVRLTSEARIGAVDQHFTGDEVQGTYRYLAMRMDAREREHTFQNDAAVRLGGIELEAGQKSVFRTITSHRDATYGGASLANAFRNDAEVHAGYVAAHRAAGNFRVDAGLRLEAERTRTLLETAAGGRTVHLFPSLRARWVDSRRPLVYRLGYGRRIHRPGADMLDPNAMWAHDLNEIVGNPALRSEVSDQVEAGIERHGSRFVLHLTPFHRWTRDAIRPFKLVTGSGHGTTTLANLARARATGADGSLRAQLSHGTVMTLAGGVAYMQTTADSVGSNGVHVTARLTVDVPVTANTMAQVYAYGRSAQAIEQGEILPAFTTHLALTRRVAGARGRVTLRLNDPLRSDRLEFLISEASFTQQTRRRSTQPLVSLFASYAVGGQPSEDAPVRAERAIPFF